MDLYKLLFLISFYTSFCFGQQLYTAQLDQAVYVNSTYVPNYINTTVFRVSKFNRTAFVLNWEFESFIDYDETVFYEVEAFTSRFNNNQYTKSPFRIPKMDFCAFLKGPYTNYFKEQAKETSNFPQEDPLCPMKKVV